ncbi:MAG: hypothetical protein WBA10_06815 [Elainellaceae cyanobacterium]
MTISLSRWFAPLSGSKTRKLRQELHLLLHGQDQTADRLLALEKQHSPGHDEAWYLDKVIYDLQRRR